MRAQKSGFNLLSAFLSEFFFLSALLSTQKHTQGTSEPLWGDEQQQEAAETLFVFLFLFLFLSAARRIMLITIFQITPHVQVDEQHEAAEILLVLNQNILI